MLIIGLTGPTGAGKSTVCEKARELGFFHIDCDKTARECTSKNSPLLESLEQAFKGVIENGELNRKKLAEKAFSSSESTEKLNSITLPFILSRIEEEIEEARKSGEKYILLDAPTLFESGADSLCEVVIGLLARKEDRLRRIILRDGISKEEAERRMSAGKTDDFYLERCKHIIYNNEGLSSLEDKASELLSHLKEGIN
jgi:dephospho-CoA kinase